MGLRDYIAFAAKQYGADPGLLDNMARLESNYRPGVQNNWDSNAKAGTPSYGLFQFIQPTFNSYASQAKAANPQAWKPFAQLNWQDPRQQALAASWAVKNGHGSAWSTYGRAQQAAGSYNYKPTYNTVANVVSPQRVFGYQDVPMAERARINKMKMQHEAYNPVTLTDQQRRQLAMNAANVDQMREIVTNRKAENLDYNSQVDEYNAALESRAMQRAQQNAQDAVNTGNANALMQAQAAMQMAPNLRSYKDILSFGNQFGLRIDGPAQTTGGSHTDGSLHYAGKAVDFGDAKNSPAKLRQLAAFVQANPSLFREFFYDPLGWYVKNGKIIKGSIGGHGDHAHVGVF